MVVSVSWKRVPHSVSEIQTCIRTRSGTVERQPRKCCGQLCENLQIDKSLPMELVPLHHGIDIDSRYVVRSEAVRFGPWVAKDRVEFSVHSPRMVRDADLVSKKEPA
ncbi:hypothetical protein Pla52n_00830 [Stieleria varia]|uniref:Uncharacterized protein n=1 Tax=Stieleria varia TaxID=2528005 RepID=A0A5C6B6D4_9BACT|nr:hypothetical protein Pla52n_00830 [Stieleria varia]